ncbi:uncharacterized protein LOC143586629 [Bidens hawaiensis]|uniref:uncharacterized protein LOC143586629 n=1 Tax=Bidens hawaiensis TaxID=980011 RepID=UPI0040491735
MALAEGFEFITSQSNKQRLKVRCRSEDCQWSLRSRNVKDSDAFYVTSFNDVHTCSKTSFHPHHRNANRKVVSHCINDLVKDNSRNIKGKDIVNILNERFMAHFSYKQAWAKKVYAETLLVCTSDESFGRLPIYCHNLEIANPGTRTPILRDGSNLFEMSFVAIGAAIRSFVRCLRPMIIIDGAHLKGSFKGTMFPAVGMDGNHKIFAIAFSVGKSDSGESWAWFLSKLRECVGDHPKTNLVRHNAGISPCVSRFLL